MPKPSSIAAAIIVVLTAAAAAPSLAQNKQTGQQGVRPPPAPVVTRPVTPPPRPETYSIQVCNRSSARAAVSWSYQREQERGSQRWYYEGWTVIEPGVCADRTVVNRNVYVFATKKDATDTRWAGSHNLCAWYPGPYNLTMNSGDVCNGTLEPYKAIYIDGSAIVYNLTN